ncbi:hypothetical protein HBI42_219730 [Parastagonospora nodorum]|nr:hypothetical protein HBI47_219960 [Parastagonospora nodorum]KAH6201685.1 hypothetical protein HBI43_217270 [Parastagonospora nodorum]KAH6243375.1 hypothetical protein HBI42_219730 [Parastagonospora nodorum]
MLAAIETEAQERFRQAEAAHSARGEYMCEQREAHQKHARELGSATRNHAEGARQEAQRHHGQVYHLDTQRTRTGLRHPFEQTASKAQLGLAVQSARRIQHDKANQRERECNSDLDRGQRRIRAPQAQLPHPHVEHGLSQALWTNVLEQTARIGLDERRQEARELREPRPGATGFRAATGDIARREQVQ